MSNVVLQPVSMLRPNETQCIYGPSRWDPPVTLTEADLMDYADAGTQPILYQPTPTSKPQRVTAYGFGLWAWYIVTGGGD